VKANEFGVAAIEVEDVYGFIRRRRLADHRNRNRRSPERRRDTVPSGRRSAARGKTKVLAAGVPRENEFPGVSRRKKNQ
jgi:hypothetical protein